MRRIALVVDEVQLDLGARHRAIGVEPRLGEHPLERVEAAPHLLPVAGAIFAAEDGLVDVLAHSGLPVQPYSAVLIQP